jgi:hypothetical protein
MPQLDQLASLTGGQSGGGDLADWSGIFDAGDEAVQDELRRQEG